MKKFLLIIGLGLLGFIFWVRPGATLVAERTVVDMIGREVALPADVERIVTATYPIATQMVFMLDAAERLVGISSYDLSPVMQRIAPQFDQIALLGSASHADIGVEELLSLEPDVVFTHMRSSNNLKEADIPAVCLALENPQALMDGFLLLGEILNRQERAREIIAYYNDKLDYIRSRTADIEPKKRVYFAGPDMLTTAGGDFYQHFLIEYAGGINVARENCGGWSRISMEQLLAWNPDFIFMGNYGTARVENFMQDSRLHSLSAVKSGAVYMSRHYIGSWDVPTPESLLGIMWLAGELYPEAVQFDMASEMRGFYERFYGYTPTDAEIAEVL